MTAPALDELLPCPFCGSPGIQFINIGCSNKACLAWALSMKSREAWNTRAAQRPAAPAGDDRVIDGRSQCGYCFAWVSKPCGEGCQWHSAPEQRQATQPDRIAALEAVAVALQLFRSLVKEGGVPRYTVIPGAALNTVIEESVDPALARLGSRT